MSIKVRDVMRNVAIAVREDASFAEIVRTMDPVRHGVSIFESRKQREEPAARMRQPGHGGGGRIAQRWANWQALIMRLRFGLDGYAPQTPRQIAGQMGLTPHWVRQLEKKSLAWMRRDGSRGLQAWAS